MSNKINVAETVLVKTTTEQVATMVVNGVAQQTQDVTCVILACPHCNHVLTKFQPEASLLDVYRSLGSMPESAELYNFCPKCGTKLSFDKRVVDEQGVN